MPPSTRGYRTVFEAASLVLGPLLMSIGDLIHPREEMDAADQAAIIIEHASRWYVAHLLLFIGLLVFIPGILAVTSLTADRRPVAGYVARVLILAGVGVFTAVFVAEMLMGRYVADGANQAAATALLETFQSGWMFGAVGAGLVMFFGGVAVFVVPLGTMRGQLRWPALIFALGALLILIEIVTSEVRLSQMGNVLILIASIAFAWHILRNDASIAHA
jgi:hypothetical protein